MLGCSTSHLRPTSGRLTRRLGKPMLYLCAWTKVIFPARIDNLVAGALWGVVCALALFALLLVWTVGAAAWDGVVRTRQRPVEGGSMIQRLVTWAVLCLVFVPTVAVTGVFLVAAFLWTARRLLAVLGPGAGAVGD